MDKIIKMALFIFAVGALFVVGITLLGSKKKGTFILVQGPIKVLENPECSIEENVKVLTVLNKGERVRVLGVKYPKNCMVYRIRLADGRVGYITHGDSFKVLDD